MVHQRWERWQLFISDMLKKLLIKNYTVIEQAEIHFQPGLNVITGETGAGKSLLLDAIGSLIGERRGGFPIRTGSDRAYIEAEFDSRSQSVLTGWLKTHGFSVDLPVILRREFYKDGNTASSRTRVFINDSPATVALVRELGILLMDMHGQHEVVTLFDRNRQLSLLDSFSGNTKFLSKYQGTFGELHKLKEKHKNLQDEINDARDGRDALKRKAEELEQLSPQPQEIVQIEKELDRLENSEKIFDLCREMCDLLNEKPGSAVEKLSDTIHLLPDLYPYYAELKDWDGQLQTIRSTITELNRSLLEISRDVSHDPGRVEKLRQRLMLLTGFLKRWNCPGDDPCNIAEETKRKLDELNRREQELRLTVKEISSTESVLLKAGIELSKHRKKAASALIEQVEERLASIGMEKARFSVAFEALQMDKPYEDGLDRIDFTFSPNAKLPHQVLKKVASGGELSRILLALKGSLAGIDGVETLAFDEIDQGISGRMAHMVGLELLNLARNHQMIVVTHLPQIASLGDLHLSVCQESSSGAATVNVLDGEERIVELASLLAATGISDSALQNAREMFETAQNLKSAS
ncbi:hypothetical protein CEE37_03555 [candidate division LCP-89 bacterium B3_LCP]|uniref:DNA repair protein RecN n=1 Tax=candidate division LCP-89 bacterium B3_LCP TaxID=2012998 RepID=A0A532V396_UNCL8|nr:MAG: hypothetical protein CEE37_03555 [candidate division LCP-89 bacterium B3_LCP]